MRLIVLQEKFALEQCRNRRQYVNVRLLFQGFVQHLAQFVLRPSCHVCRNKVPVQRIADKVYGEYSKSGELEYW